MKNRKNISYLLFLFVSLFIFASCNNAPVESTTNNEGVKTQEQTINQDENVQNQDEENQNLEGNQDQETIASNENNEESSEETQENSQEQIIEAIKKDDIKEVKSLTKNIDIDLRDENNKTLLMYAVENNALKVVDYFLSINANPNLKDNNDKTVFDYNKTPEMEQVLLSVKLLPALVQENWNELERLLGNYDINTAFFYTSCGHYTLLMKASELGKFEIVKKLLEKGAEVNVASEIDYDNACGGYTALLLTKNVSIAKLLLSKGAEIDALLSIKGDYVSSLGNAVENNNLLLVNLLLKYNADPSYGIEQAVKSKNLTITELLLNNGANVDYSSVSENNKDTILIEAVKSNNFPMVKLLLRYGADINKVSLDTLISPLMYATQNKNKEMVKYLISNGADTDLKDSNGFTALNYATDDIMRQILINRPNGKKVYLIPSQK